MLISYCQNRQGLLGKGEGRAKLAECLSLPPLKAAKHIFFYLPIYPFTSAHSKLYASVSRISHNQYKNVSASENIIELSK